MVRFFLQGFNRITSPALLGLAADLADAEADKEALLKDATRKMFAEFDARCHFCSSSLLPCVCSSIREFSV